MKLKPHDLAGITARTLEHYNRSADDFWQGTRDHDVSQNIDALLRHIRGVPPESAVTMSRRPSPSRSASLTATGPVPTATDTGAPRTPPAEPRQTGRSRKTKRSQARLIGDGPKCPISA